MAPHVEYLEALLRDRLGRIDTMSGPELSRLFGNIYCRMCDIAKIPGREPLSSDYWRDKIDVLVTITRRLNYIGDVDANNKRRQYTLIFNNLLESSVYFDEIVPITSERFDETVNQA